jgi:hypothetical protein
MRWMNAFGFAVGFMALACAFSAAMPGAETCAGGQAPAWLTAESPGQEGTIFNLAGNITAASPGKLTVNTQGEIIFHVSYASQTPIVRKDGSAGSSKDLKVGVYIQVEGQLNSSGVVEAKSIKIVEPPAGSSSGQGGSVPFEASGLVVERSAHGFAFITEPQSIYDVKLSSATVLRRSDGSAAPLKSLHPGMFVVVHGTWSGCQDIEASVIDLGRSTFAR